MPTDEDSMGQTKPISLSGFTVALRSKFMKSLRQSGHILPFKQLYRFAPTNAMILSWIGVIVAVLNSTLMPFMFIVFGDTTDLFINKNICGVLNIYEIYDICPAEVNDLNFHLLYHKCNLSLPGAEIPKIDLVKRSSFKLIHFTLIGLGTFIFSAIQNISFSYAGELIVRELRKRLFRSILSQSVHWCQSHDVNTYLTDNVNRFKDGISDRIGFVVQALGTLITVIVFSLFKNWTYALAVIAGSPLLVFASILTTIVTLRNKNDDLHLEAEDIAGQTIRNIRTVQAFDGQRRVIKQYQSHLNQIKFAGIRKATLNALMSSILWFAIFVTYALGFWYGGRLEIDGKISIGAILTVFLGIQAAIYRVANIPIDANHDGNTEPDEITMKTDSGHLHKKDIVFKSVSFSYPNRPDVKVLEDFSLMIPGGKTTALVGTSGSGRSALVHLLLRNHQAQSGAILVGGIDIGKFEVRSYQSRIGLLTHDPSLFSVSIASNVRFGKKNATDGEIRTVCKIANAEEFIRQLPSQYKTQINQSRLNDEQKQKVAIARVLISDPQILIVDKVTSGLDSQNANRVHEILRNVSRGRTTIIIACRLSQIRNADFIVHMHKGRIVELGTDRELMERNGIYSLLVKMESKQTDEDFDWEAKQMRAKKNPIRSISDHASTFENKDFDERDVTVFMFRMNKPEFIFVFIGCLSCAGFGLMQTLFEIYFAKTVVGFAICWDDSRIESINGFCLIFVVFSIISLVVQVVSGYCFGVSGENLTKRLRTNIFELLLRQDIAFFDRPNNSVERLCTMLSSTASLVHGSTGIRLGVIVSDLCILTTGTILALVYSWRLTLVFAAFVPFLTLATFLSMKFKNQFDVNDKNRLKKAHVLIDEALPNIVKVKQLNIEQNFIDEYDAIIEDAFSKTVKKCIIIGLLFGISQSIVFFTIGTGFFASAHFVERQKMDIQEMMIVFAGLLFASMALGQNQVTAPTNTKSREAAVAIYEFLKSQPELDSMTDEGIIPKTFNGHYSFSNVNFHHPLLDNLQVLKNISASFEGDSKIAIIGRLESGTSMILKLMERFYAPTSGEIFVDGINIKDINIRWYRRQLGLVESYPVLFNWSIGENIKFGDTSRDKIPTEEIRKIAALVNIDDFISGLPDGYDTQVGCNEVQLTPNQKQLICIARALIRRPKFLLIDDTMLDQECEQRILTHMAETQNGVIIAASAVEAHTNYNHIFVISHGEVVESGNHSSLLKKDGLYAQLSILSKK
ncbi:hypothetical protein ACOME3_000749 [Neoechinorhynchus agilis]